MYSQSLVQNMFLICTISIFSFEGDLHN
uniref:Uncharacterized protein n=1 Tax=Arundo donax TaxID=35708 RepID=A0A0A8YVL6_ARUDO